MEGRFACQGPDFPRKLRPLLRHEATQGDTRRHGGRGCGPGPPVATPSGAGQGGEGCVR